MMKFAAHDSCNGDILLLPSDVIRVKVLPLLGIADLANLDSAACNDQARFHLAECMRGHETVVHTEEVPLLVCALRWLKVRAMFVESFVLYNAEDLRALVDADVLLPLKRTHNLAVMGVGDSGEALTRIVNMVDNNSLSGVSLDGTVNSVTDTNIKSLVASQKLMLKVSINNSPAVTDESLKIIAQNCAGLKELSVTYCENVVFAPETMATFSSACFRLVKLKLCTRLRIDEALRQVSIYCVYLEELDVRLCPEVDDGALAPVLLRCTCLKLLNLARTAVSTKSFAVIARRCQFITSLSMSLNVNGRGIAKVFSMMKGKLVSFSGFMFPRAILASVVFWGESMRSLDLCLSRVSDEILICIAQNCINLSYLSVSDFKKVKLSDASLQALSSSTPFLRTLIIWGGCCITDQGVLALSQGCSQLTKLSLCSSSALTRISLLPLIRDCTHLEKVELKSCIDFHHDLIVICTI